MPCMHIAFSHCFRWHFLFADKRVSGNKNYRMYRAIKQIQILGYTDYRKCYQFYRKKFAMHCKFHPET